MSNFSLQQISGDNAVQDSDSITIAKADLTQNTGFIASDEDDGESILAALVIQAEALGLDTLHRDGTDEIDANFNQQVAVNPPVTTFVTRQDDEGNSIWFKRDSYTVDFDLPLASSVNPSDY
ncbi:hypothetical protein [Nostoc sp.]|uniref:hypothetical protein n=1 Tax=Nostoc sp. TaxID=1180 RepID=UPI002FF7F76E